MPAVQETVEQVRRIDVDRIREGSEGPLGRYDPVHLGEEERA
jgi:hypothetical protein